MLLLDSEWPQKCLQPSRKSDMFFSSFRFWQLSKAPILDDVCSASQPFRRQFLANVMSGNAVIDIWKEKNNFANSIAVIKQVKTIGIHMGPESSQWCKNLKANLRIKNGIKNSYLCDQRCLYSSKLKKKILLDQKPRKN